MKKLMLLGGSRYLLPVIETAHRLGVYVITCDYLPDNIAHKFSDKYINVSVIDKEAVLEVAKKESIDGIMSFACDPGVVTAAYVAEKLGLPGNNPYQSVAILQNKGKFRKFLKDNGFNVPDMKVFTSWNDVKKEYMYFQYPVIVKPTDSAGSKGVTKVNNMDLTSLEKATNYAFDNSLSHEIIIEEFIEKNTWSTDTDSFSVDGKLVFFSVNAQLFDCQAENIYTPAAFCWPSMIPAVLQEELRNEIQRLLSCLKMGTSIYNIEACVGKDGKVYIMEVSPRAGGNRLAEMLRYTCGQDIILTSIQGALGMAVDRLYQPVYRGYWGLVILHSNQCGIFNGINLENKIVDIVQEIDLWINEGDYVKCFTGANEAIGTLVLKCNDKDELFDVMTHIHDYIKIEVL